MQKLIVNDPNGIGTFHWTLPPQVSAMLEKVLNSAKTHIPEERHERTEQILQLQAEMLVMTALVRLCAELPFSAALTLASHLDPETVPELQGNAQELMVSMELTLQTRMAQLAELLRNL